MSKVFLFITNGPAGSGKDAISASVQKELEKNPNNIIMKESFKNTIFKFTAQLFPEFKAEYFLNTDDDGEYGRKNKELPNPKLNLAVNVSEDTLEKFYSSVNNELGVDNSFKDHIKTTNFSKEIEKFKEKYEITGSDLSPRNALIFISEYIIKPIYGEDFFGSVVSKNIENTYEKYKNDNRNIQIFITDSGFPAELKGIDKLAKEDKVKPIVLSIYREGYDYDHSKDSRRRLTTETLQEFGINIPIEKVMNDKDLTEVGIETAEKVKQFNALGRIEPDFNKLSVSTYVYNKDHIMNFTIINNLLKELNQLSEKTYLSKLNLSNSNLEFDICLKEGLSRIEKHNIKNQVSRLNERLFFNPHQLNFSTISSSQENDKLEFDKNLSKSFKNLHENQKTLKKEFSEFSSFIKNYTNLKTKTNEISQVFFEVLYRETDKILYKCNMTSPENLVLSKETIQALKSLNTLAKSNLKLINKPSITTSFDQTIHVAVNKDFKDTILNLKKEFPVDVNYFLRKNKINLITDKSGKEFYEIKGVSEQLMSKINEKFNLINVDKKQILNENEKPKINIESLKKLLTEKDSDINPIHLGYLGYLINSSDSVISKNELVNIIVESDIWSKTTARLFVESNPNLINEITEKINSLKPIEEAKPLVSKTKDNQREIV